MKSPYNSLFNKQFKLNPNYTVDDYLQDIDEYGLETVWKEIIDLFNHKDDSYGVLTINHFGELYEIGLAHVSKVDKKEHGKYYTPHDVADLMSDWLIDLKGENVCDVCCGTGNLTLSYLEKLGEEKARELICSGNLHLYDQDKLALYICQSIIGICYGREIIHHIHCVCGDFLNHNIKLPDNCKVISNPPYHQIKEIKEDWDSSEILSQTNEFYSAIMEKVIKNSKASVIITPYSFIGASKFYPLRRLMNKYNGFIISFDNIPVGLFNGRKHGIFNTNIKNSVRAAITVVENKEGVKGFKCSPLLRFRSKDRTLLLRRERLESFIGTQYQVVQDDKSRYAKCFRSLEPVLQVWEQLSSQTLSDLIREDGQYQLYIPNTCRYFTVGSERNLERSGKITLSFNDEETYAYVYCLINSSFCYWHWRLYDGGITYPPYLLKELPVFLNQLSVEDKAQLLKIASEMMRLEEEYLVYKKNAGKLQENIKFPDVYRKQINQLFFKALGLQGDVSILEAIHANSVISD